MLLKCVSLPTACTVKNKSGQGNSRSGIVQCSLSIHLARVLAYKLLGFAILEKSEISGCASVLKD